MKSRDGWIERLEDGSPAREGEGRGGIGSSGEGRSDGGRGGIGSNGEGRSDGGRERKLYRLTDLGRSILDLETRRLKALVDLTTLIKTAG